MNCLSMQCGSESDPKVDPSLLIMTRIECAEPDVLLSFVTVVQHIR
jgi:hypothetical protein